MNRIVEDLNEIPITVSVGEAHDCPDDCAMLEPACEGPMCLDAAMCRELADALTRAADVLERGEIARKEQQLARLDREIQRIAAERDALCNEIARHNVRTRVRRLLGKPVGAIVSQPTTPESK